MPFDDQSSVSGSGETFDSKGDSLRSNLPADPMTSINASAFPTVPRPDQSPTDMPTLGMGDTPPPSPVPSSRVESPYELIRIIGHGGQGVVWEAVQTALGRVIAVKSMRSDMVARAGDDNEMVTALFKTFRQEALTTGGLEHPNIVPVYDLGEDAEGRPLMAMKIVRGQPWDKVINADAKLDFAEFLDKHLPILAQVIQAVAFAHSRSVIHRDLKPSQVMIGEYGEVLLTDWGLAVYLGAEDTTRPLEARRIAELPTRDSSTNPSGTPAFMAPEQTHNTGASLGPWTDVYLLGATLFLLLTGTVPHLGATAQAAFEMAQRGVVPTPQERAPDRDIPEELSALCRDAMRTDPKDRIPSAKEFHQRLSDYLTGASRRRESMQLTESAARRLESGAKDYSALTSILQDLEQARSLWTGNTRAAKLHADAIVLYAESALANGDLTLAQVQAERLAAGAQRSGLMNQIDAARHRSAAHARQRRLAFAGLVMLGIALLVGGFFLRSARHREEEQARLASIMQRVNKLRLAEQALAEELALGVPLPDTINPDSYRRSRLNESQVESMIERRNKLRQERDDLRAVVAEEVGHEPFPLVLAEANLQFSRAASSANYMSAYRLYEQAATRRPHDPEPLTGMGVSVAMAGFPTTATLHLHEASKLTRANKGAQSPEYATALALEAEANRMVDDSSALYLKQYEESLSVLSPIWANYSLDLADRYRRLGNPLRAMELTSATLTVLPADTRDFQLLAAKARFQLGQTFLESGDPANALDYQRQAYETRKELLGDEHPDTMESMRSLTFMMSEAGRFGEALEWVHKGQTLSERLDGADSTNYSVFLGIEAAVLLRAGDYEKAEELVRRKVAIHENKQGVDHPDTAGANYLLGMVLAEAGKPEQALAVYETAIDSYRRAFGPNHINVARLYVVKASAFNSMGRRDLGRKTLEEALVMMEGAQSTAKPWLAVLHHELAITMDGGEEAEPHFREALKLRREALGEDHAFTGYSYDALAGHLIHRDKCDEAQPLLMKALAIYGRQAGYVSMDYATCLSTVSTLLRCQHRDNEGAILSLRALELFEQIAGPDHPETRFARETLYKFWAASPEMTRERMATRDFAVFCYYEQQRLEGRRHLNAGGFRGAFVNYFQGSVTLLARSTPPRTDAARRAILRATAYANVAGPQHHLDWRKEFLDPVIQEFGLQEAVANIPPVPDSLKNAAEEGAEGKLFHEYLDTVAAPIDFKAEFPEISDWTTSHLEPSGEVLKKMADDIVAKLERETAGVPLPGDSTP